MSGKDKMKMGFMKAVAAKLKKAAKVLEDLTVQEESVAETASEVQTSEVQATDEVSSSGEIVSNEIVSNEIVSEEIVSDETPVTDKKTELIKVLQSQDELLDSILSEQNKMHSNVKERDWESLQDSISALRRMSDTFVELDQQREMLTEADSHIYYEPSVEPLFVSLRTKLTKSRIENDALRTYVTTTKDFIGNVIEECFVKTATTYSPAGKLVKPEVGNVLVNIEF